MDVDEFIARMKQPKGKLPPWEEEIFALLNAKANYRDVVNFLGQNGVAVSVSAVHDFVHAKKRAWRLEQANSTPARSAEVPASIPQIQPAAQPSQAALPKFDWQATRSKTVKW